MLVVIETIPEHDGRIWSPSIPGGVRIEVFDEKYPGKVYLDVRGGKPIRVTLLGKGKYHGTDHEYKSGPRNIQDGPGVEITGFQYKNGVVCFRSMMSSE